MTTARLLALVTSAVVAAAAAGLEGPLVFAVNFGFVALVPGLVVVRLFTLPVVGVVRLAAAVGLSLAIVVEVNLVALWVDRWEPVALLYVIAAAVFVGLAVEERRSTA